MNRIVSLVLATVAIMYTNSALATEHPTIMVSIKPFYNLCAKVMLSVGKPELLLQHNASPHDYHLKPSDVKLIESSSLVIWGGPELEGYLQKPLANRDNSRDLNLATIPGLKLLPIRSSTNWAEHDHDHGDHDHHHEHAVHDAHFWLDPDNAILIVQAIAKRLAVIDPQHAKIYAKNAKDFAQELKQKRSSWSQQLAVMQNNSFIVFHDAYQYFENAFGLHGAGSISLNPEIPPSAQRIQEIQTLLNQQHVRCIFSEPQFNYKIIDSLSNGLNIYRGVLDPLGQDADIGPKGYLTLIDDLVTSFVACGNFKAN